MISRHMEGYEKQEICYTHLEKTFSRDIFGMSADQQKKNWKNCTNHFCIADRLDIVEGFLRHRVYSVKNHKQRKKNLDDH